MSHKYPPPSIIPFYFYILIPLLLFFSFSLASRTNDLLQLFGLLFLKYLAPHFCIFVPPFTYLTLLYIFDIFGVWI